MPKFRKKPVVIEAIRFTGEDDIHKAQVFTDYKITGIAIGVYGGPIWITTLEGEMRCDPGDWIIRGIKGEFYPCKPDIFEATYEPVPEGL